MGYRKDNKLASLPSGQELLMSTISFSQFILLGTFAAILAAHRSEIIEKEEENAEVATYETPYTAETN
jgi:hypothetical protein